MDAAIAMVVNLVRRQRERPSSASARPPGQDPADRLASAGQIIAVKAQFSSTNIRRPYRERTDEHSGTTVGPDIPRSRLVRRVRFFPPAR